MAVERLLPPEKRVGFTHKQRDWIKRAYEEILGFSGCVFPVWNGDEYVYCGKTQVEVHHIKPRGWCIRVLNIDPNVPENAAPVCAEHHRIGQSNRPLTREAQDCIHLDAAWALRNYRGTKPPTAFDKIFQQRIGLTDKQTKYWYDLWDQYLLELAWDVVNTYYQLNPADEWPQRRW